MRIRVLGIDPSLRNMGLAIMELDLESMKLNVSALTLARTERSKGKKVRVSSDDLRAAKEMCGALATAADGVAVGFAEVPSGAQSARGALSNGIAIGILASSPVPLIEVTPTEVKLATVGTKTASKEEMIEWAMEAYPDAPWLMRKHNGILKPIADNEHLADACAVVHAGIRTDDFKRLVAMTRGTA